MEPFKTIVEPFRIHSVQPISFTTPTQREQALQRAGYNLFGLPAREVMIDLLTDSGTGAMSTRQWGKMMDGDESYAGSDSFYRLKEAVENLTGFTEVIPTHQGRAAERILFETLIKPGDIVPNNTHFDTTRANVEYRGAEARDLLIGEGHDPALVHPFKGNMDLAALEETLLQASGRVPLVLVTVTNNSCGGQPVSLENLKAVRVLCDRYQILLFLDACRFAENAYFIKLREPGYSHRSAADLAREMFSLADGCLMSAKKDGLANIGGFLAMHDLELASRCRDLLILTEGFVTYGGLAGYDMEAIAQGLQEVVDEAYLQYRLRSIAYLVEKLAAAGIPVLQPPGGHAVYLDARKLLPHIPPHQYPAQALAVELYRQGGVRSAEMGTVMFGKPQSGAPDTPAPMELVRLALPRRTYTQSHIDYVTEVILRVAGRAAELTGYRIVAQPPWLRHFTARFECLGVPALQPR